VMTLNDVRQAFATDTVVLSTTKVAPDTSTNAVASKLAALTSVTVPDVVSYGISTSTQEPVGKVVPWGVSATIEPLNDPAAKALGLLMALTSPSAKSATPISTAAVSDPALNESFIFRPPRAGSASSFSITKAAPAGTVATLLFLPALTAALQGAHPASDCPTVVAQYALTTFMHPGDKCLGSIVALSVLHSV
jgi:hypothetical protein